MAAVDSLLPLGLLGAHGPSGFTHAARPVKPVAIDNARWDRGGLVKVYDVSQRLHEERLGGGSKFVVTPSFSFRGHGGLALVAMCATYGIRERRDSTRYQQDQRLDAKRLREADDYFRYQRRVLQAGVPEPDEGHWRRQEQVLFDTTHVTQGINFSKYDDIPVERTGGRGDEKVCDTFADILSEFELPPELEKTIQKCGYNVPTPVQKHAIPAGLVDTDVLVSAQTGSGKTAAFLIPLIAACLKEPPAKRKEGAAMPRGVIMAPTRELCQQITAEALRLCFRTRLRIVSIYGGSPAPSQLKQLAEGCDIAICTPGRMSDFLERGVMSVKEVKYLVLDEGDRMLDMGFEPQIRDIVQGYDMPGPGQGGRTSMMFSATFPKEIQQVAAAFMDRSYLHIAVGRVGTAVSNVEQRFVDAAPLDRDEKIKLLIETLDSVQPAGGTGRTKSIVFANTKRDVDYLVYRLSEARLAAGPIHGNLTQAQRDRALLNLKQGGINVLVATEVAARGLDLPGIDHVVNYDLPQNSDDYVHRIGRTGRIGNKGVATSFVNSNEPALTAIVKCIQQGDEKGEIDLPGWLIAQAKRPTFGSPRSYGGGGGYGGGGYGGYNRGSNGYGGKSYGKDRYGGGGYGGQRPSYGRYFDDDDDFGGPPFGGKGKGKGKSYGGGKGKSKGMGKGMGMGKGKGKGKSNRYFDDDDDDDDDFFRRW